MSDDLTGKQRRHLRRLGHGLKPVVLVGKAGSSETVAQAVDVALTDHELIKIKVLDLSPAPTREVAAHLASTTGAALAQVLGRTALLYRAHPKEPQIQLPPRAS